MARIAVNGVELAVERSGEGDPLVLVHGSWGDRTGWVFVEEELAQRFHVVSYDRRGHSTSPSATGTRRDDEDDLAALIEHLGLAPAHVVGNSFGASITLGLASRRPELVRSAFVHEPPLLGLAAADPVVVAVSQEIDRVAHLIESGDPEGAAHRFVDVALGPGAWDFLPPEERARMASNAATFAEELGDPEGYVVDTAALAEASMPMMVTYGDQSPAFFEKVIDALRRSMPTLSFVELEGAGHLPHLTNAPEWLAALRAFLAPG